MKQFYIRLGALGEIHHAQAADDYPRGCQVIVRTLRGLEQAEVVGNGARQNIASEAPHRILRAMTQQDELLVRRLERHKRAAIENCRSQLANAGCDAVLLDVDQLLDGGTLVMHFLGTVDEVAESITTKIVDEYEKVVRSRHLAKLMHDGCGPGCGESEGSGCESSCSSGGCAGCGVAAVKDQSRSKIRMQESIDGPIDVAPGK